MDSDFLSDVELYFSNLAAMGNKFKIEGEEKHHIIDVMRHSVGDNLYITDGKGSIFYCKIANVDKKFVEAEILETKFYENTFSHIIFCIPRLKSAERFEFALEKCVELGVTNFIVFESARAIAKGEKLERWQKILLSAMKQSLRSWLPKIRYAKNFNELISMKGQKIIFDQSAIQSFNEYLSTYNNSLTTDKYLIFGPEGGLTEEELEALSAEGRGQSDINKVKLTENRLRSETAIISAAMLLSTLHL